MRQDVTKLLKIALILGLAFITTFTVSAFSGRGEEEEEEGRLERPFARYGPYVRQLDAGGAEELATRAFELQHKWMLEPRVFDQLSVAGKRMVLQSNGMLPRPQVIQTLRDANAGHIVTLALPGDNVQVNDPRVDEIGHTQSESSIAVNGNNIIVGFNDASDNTSGYSVSTDGGITFSHKRIPTLPNGLNFGDPVLAFGPNGELYYATLAVTSNNKSIIGVSKSTNNGITFTTPVDASTTAGNTADFQDKEWLVVDTGASSPFKGNVYVSWSDFTRFNGNFINFSRSTNGGTSFEAPVTVSPKDRTQFVQGSMPAVAPNGDIYIAYFDLHINPAGISVVKSTDGGKTFSAPKTVASFFNIQFITAGTSIRTNSFPGITVDKNGTVHIVYAAIPPTFGADRSDILYVRSTDGGASFSAPRKVNDDNTNTTQFLPSIAAAADGTIGVKWWDRRNDPINDGLTDVYMAISTDGGASFNRNFRITDTNWAFGPTELGLVNYHGDYDDIKAFGDNFYLCWSDERNIDPDVFFTMVPVKRDPNSPDFNISTARLFDSVVAGNSVDFALNTSALNSFSGNLTISVTPNIGGVSFNFASPTVAAGQPTRLTISTAPNVEPGTYLITVAATGGNLTRKTTFRLSVLDPNRMADAPVNITNTPGITFSSAGFKMDDAGTIHLCYEDDSLVGLAGNEIFYMQSVDAGKTYSKPVKISTNGPVSFNSALAIDGSGNIYITWSSLTADQTGADIFLARSIDRGRTFSAPIKLSSSTQISDMPAIAADKNGNVIVTYVDFATRNFGFFAVLSNNSGVSFAAPMRVSRDAESAQSGYVAFDSKGAAYVVYLDGAASASSVNFAIAADGKRFGTPKIISDSRVPAFFPHLAIDNSDGIYVTFYNRTGTNAANQNRDILVVKSTDGGRNFGRQVNVSNDTGQSVFPFLILDNKGTVNVVWQDSVPEGGRLRPTDIMFARSNDGGTSFSRPVNLSGNSGQSNAASGFADSTGKVFVAFVDDSSANTEIYTTTVAAPAANPVDFSLVFNPAQITGQRGQKGQITANISRTGGFSGNVTVTAPDTKAIKVKLTPPSASTTGASVNFSFKIKKKAPTGPQQLTFTGRDDSGRARTATLTLVIQ
ncbi:MAG: sialidase family protein [Acidobacteriota bacterium]